LILYLDTSVLVAALTNEAQTAGVQTWLGAQTPESLTISDWVVTEFSSVLSIKLRTGQIDATHRAAALTMFARMGAESFSRLPVTAYEFQVAARFADQYDIGVRGGDALHLAICVSHGATLCTLDRRLIEAGPRLGVMTTSP
jgi:uncharacterized protein